MLFLEDAYTEILLLEIDTYCIDNAPERVWNLDRDMKGWRVGERPDLLFDLGKLGKWMMPFIPSRGKRVCVSPSSSPSVLQG